MDCPPPRGISVFLMADGHVAPPSPGEGSGGTPLWPERCLRRPFVAGAHPFCPALPSAPLRTYLRLCPRAMILSSGQCCRRRCRPGSISVRFGVSCPRARSNNPGKLVFSAQDTVVQLLERMAAETSPPRISRLLHSALAETSVAWPPVLPLQHITAHSLCFWAPQHSGNSHDHTCQRAQPEVSIRGASELGSSTTLHLVAPSTTSPPGTYPRPSQADT